MRFKAQIEDNKCRWLRTLCYSPHWVFSVDLIYYIMLSYNLDWIPYGFSDFCHLDKMEIPKPGSKPRTFTPHPFSPCTCAVRCAVKNIIRSSTLDYDMIYEKLLPSGAENKLERFSKYVHKVTNRLLEKKCVGYTEVLLKFTHIGRLTAVFYKHGTKDCAHIVPLIISGTLTKLTQNVTYAQCFNDLTAAAWIICDSFRYNDVEIIGDEYFDECLDQLTGEDSKDSDAKEMLGQL